MTKNKLPLLGGILFLTITLGGCSQYDDFSLRKEVKSDYNDETIYRYHATLHPQRTVEEAIKLAGNFGQTFGPQTRSTSYSNSTNWEVQSICYNIGKADTRSTKTDEAIEPVDTIYYLLNNPIANSFCIIAGDRRIGESLLAFSSEGTLNIDSLDGTEGINAFLSILPDYYEKRLNVAKRRKDSITNLPDFVNDGKVFHLDTITRKIIDTTKPNLSLYESVEVDRTENLCKNNWSCNYPYNKLTPTIKHHKAELSSIIVTTAHLISSFGYPKEYKGSKLDWSLLHRYRTAEEVASDSNEYILEASNLLRNIGDGIWYKYWGPFETTENFDKIIDVLQEMGYSNPSKISTNFSFKDIIKSIDNHSPVPMYAEVKKTRNIHVSPKPYSWLCDGYRVLEIRLKGGIKYDNSEYPVGHQFKQLHINWGMGGKYNGYFYADIFNPTLQAKYDNAEDEKNTNKQDNQNYKLKMRAILNIHP